MFGSFVLLLLVYPYLEASQLEQVKLERAALEDALWKRDQQKIGDIVKKAERSYLDALLNPNCDDGGETPLHLAIRRNCSVSILELLLGAGSRIDIKIDGLYNTPLRLNLDLHNCSREDFLNLCLHYAGDQILNQLGDLECNCYECDLKEYWHFVVPLLKADLELIQSDATYVSIVRKLNDSGYSALHIVSQKGLESEFNALFCHGADIEQPVVNTGKDNGATPLFLAAQAGHLNLMRVLMAVGANINPILPDGTTALMAAAQCGHCEVVRTLINAGADRDNKRIDGETALSLALSNSTGEFPGMTAAKRKHLRGRYSEIATLLNGPGNEYMPLDCRRLIVDREKELAKRKQLTQSVVSPLPRV